jgi:hypothetical protein
LTKKHCDDILDVEFDDAEAAEVVPDVGRSERLPVKTKSSEGKFPVLV